MNPRTMRWLFAEDRPNLSTGAARRRFGAFGLATLGVVCACAGLLSIDIPVIFVTETGFQPHQLKMMSILQASVLTLIAVAIGFWAGPRLGLRSMIVEGTPPFSPLILVFLGLGLVSGVGFWGMDWVLTNQLSRLISFQFVHNAQLADLEALATPMMRLAYGGVTEEILARYGLLSAVAVTANMLLKRRRLAIGLAIVVSSFVFGLGHLPAIMAFVPDAPSVFLIKTAVLNAAIASLLAMVFVMHSLEASMVTHAGFHFALLALHHV